MTENKRRRKTEEPGFFLVEVLFEQVRVENNNTPEVKRGMELAVEHFPFKNEKRSVAQRNATTFLEDTLKNGLDKRAEEGSLLRVGISPSCIKSVALVDYTLHQIEQQAKAEALAKSQEEEVPEFEELPNRPVPESTLEPVPSPQA